MCVLRRCCVVYLGALCGVLRRPCTLLSYRGRCELDLTFEGDYFAGWIHDGAVCGDRPADGIVGVGHVDDDHLRLLAHLLSYTDELVGLHGQGAESNVGWVDSQVLELGY